MLLFDIRYHKLVIVHSTAVVAPGAPVTRIVTAVGGFHYSESPPPSLVEEKVARY